MLIIADNRGIPITCSDTISGNHNDSYQLIENVAAFFSIHHHVAHLQAYIDEYTYRFNRNFMKEKILINY